MSASTVAVIVPNYNHSKYLYDRLESVSAQTFQAAECVFLDDASQDNSLEVYKDWRKEHPNFNTVEGINKENSGSPISQWKKGLDLVSADYIWIAESDDLASPQMIEALHSRLESDDSIVMAYCRSNLIDEQGNIVTRSKRWEKIWSKKRWQSDFIMDGKKFLSKHMLLYNMIPNASAMLIRRTAFETLPFASFSRLRLNGDWACWMHLLSLEHSKIAYVATSYNLFRTHNATLRSKTKKESEDIKELHSVMHYAFIHYDLPIWRKELMRWYLSAALLLRQFDEHGFLTREKYDLVISNIDGLEENDRIIFLRLSLLYGLCVFWRVFKPISGWKFIKQWFRSMRA